MDRFLGLSPASSLSPKSRGKSSSAPSVSPIASFSKIPLSVECPICQKSIRLDYINLHMDFDHRNEEKIGLKEEKQMEKVGKDETGDLEVLRGKSEEELLEFALKESLDWKEKEEGEERKRKEREKEEDKKEKEEEANEAQEVRAEEEERTEEEEEEEGKEERTKEEEQKLGGCEEESVSPKRKREEAPPVITVNLEDNKSKRQAIEEIPSLESSMKLTQQGSLHKFFGGQDHGVPRYFYLEWPGRRCGFTNEKPVFPHAFSADFLWRGENRTVTVVCNVASGKQMPFNDSTTSYRNIPFLKSHLQKCVRRSLDTQATGTAVALMKLDMDEFLRRLPVIVVEDVILSQHFPLLIWFMVASAKGFVLHKSMVAWILGFVKALARTPVREFPHGEDDTYKPSSKNIRAVPKEKKDLIYSLHLRKAFGGMKGDLRMFNYFIKNWTDRFCSDQWKGSEFEKDLALSVVLINPDKLAPLEVDEWELAAIDFHCSNVIDLVKREREIAGRPLTYSDADIKSAMWHLGSSVTNKELVAYSMPIPIRPRIQELMVLWEDIKDDVKRVQTRLLRDRK